MTFISIQFPSKQLMPICCLQIISSSVRVHRKIAWGSGGSRPLWAINSHSENWKILEVHPQYNISQPTGCIYSDGCFNSSSAQMYESSR